MYTYPLALNKVLLLSTLHIRCQVRPNLPLTDNSFEPSLARSVPSNMYRRKSCGERFIRRYVERISSRTPLLRRFYISNLVLLVSRFAGAKLMHHNTSAYVLTLTSSMKNLYPFYYTVSHFSLLFSTNAHLLIHSVLRSR